MAKKKLYSTGGIVYSTAPDLSFSKKADPETPLPPNEQSLKIKLDTKHRRGKIVTIVKGFTMAEKDIEILAKQLKSFCGTGGSAKESEIIIQGDHQEKILQWLVKNGYAKVKKG